MLRIIHAAYEIMGRHIIFTDTSYVKLTEICPPTPTGDEKRDVYLAGPERPSDGLPSHKKQLSFSSVLILSDPIENLPGEGSPAGFVRVSLFGAGPLRPSRAVLS